MEAQQSISGISVVIPNYNGSDLLPKIIPPCILSLQNTKLPYEIIVADDCSTDNSIEFLQKEFPQIIISSAAINSGFSVTANRGISSAIYNWVLLLNSDVILEPDYFQPLLKYTSNNKIFGVTGRIVGWHDEEIQDAAKLPVMRGVKLNTSINYFLEDKAEMEDGLYSIYLSGANIFFNKKIFCFIGGFNELFSPFYVEDTELSVRAWRLGFDCMYEHNAICRHRTSSTVKKTNTKKFVNVIYDRNMMQLHAIHLQGSALKLWQLHIIGRATLKLLLFKFSYIKSLRLFIKNYPAIKQARKEIAEKASVTITLQDVITKITSSLNGKKVKAFFR